MGKKASRRRNRQVVCGFESSAHLSAAKRGGKGFSLAELVHLGVPMPPGFTVTTSVGRSSLQHGHLPRRLFGQIVREMEGLEQSTGRGFGHLVKPLLVSVRSGAEHSMPGMMDTILNLGLNPDTVLALARETGDERFAWDCYRRFLVSYGTVVHGIAASEFDKLWQKNGCDHDRESFHVRALKKFCRNCRQLIQRRAGSMEDDVWTQLTMASRAVFRSWESERARAYRRANNIPSWLGTAANIQAMVFGNRGDDSGTGVVFSRNVATGERELYGEWLPNAQGEDVVAGVKTPRPIAELESWNPGVYQELSQICILLEQHFDDVVDVEFTIESGRLFILQVRLAKRTPVAAVSHAVQMVWEKRFTKEQALERRAMTTAQLAQLDRSVFRTNELAQAVADPNRFLARGIPASPGAVTGRPALTSEQARQLKGAGCSVVLFRTETSPNDLPGMLAADAIVTEVGGATSHAAVVARSLNKPAVVGVQADLCLKLSPLQWVSVDGTSGVVLQGELPMEFGIHRREIKIFLRWYKRIHQPEIDKRAHAPRIALERRGESINVVQLARSFYLIEAMAAASSSLNATAELSRAVQKLQHQEHQEAAELMATYIVLAAAGELRHVRSSAYSNPLILDRELVHAELQKYGVIDEGVDRIEAQRSVADQLELLPLEQQIIFLQRAENAFRHLKWSTSFGGIKWADICAAALSWLEGKVTATVFVDHAFDLQHNGGRMFNKTKDFLVGNLWHLDQLLDTKRDHQGGVRGLYDKFIAGEAAGTISPEISTLYLQGQAGGLW